MMKEISQLSALNGAGPVQKLETNKSQGSSFGDMLGSAIDRVNDLQLHADKAVQQLQTGQGGNLHQVMISMEEADLSMRLMVQMRNKVMDAYQEIMRMEV